MCYEDLIHETLKVSPNSIHQNVLSILKLENKNVFLASSDQDGESLVQQIIFNSFYSFRQGLFIKLTQFQFCEHFMIYFNNHNSVDLFIKSFLNNILWFLLLMRTLFQNVYASVLELS